MNPFHEPKPSGGLDPWVGQNPLNTKVEQITQLDYIFVCSKECNVAVFICL